MDPTEDERKSVPPSAESDGSGKRRRLDSILPDIIKKGIEKGVEAGLDTLSKTDEVVRGVVGDAKLPREIAQQVLGAIDETKSGVLRVVGREVRDFLEATDLSKEIQKALTSLSFEIKTEIRFVPNDSGGVKPEVKAGSTSVKKKADKKNDRKPGDEGEDEP